MNGSDEKKKYKLINSKQHLSSIVTMAVSCLIVEIQRDICRKTPIFDTTLPFKLHDQLEPP